MDPKLLFLNRCEQAAILAASLSEIDLLDLSGILRQLIVDHHSLVDTVNSYYRLKLRFLAAETKPIWKGAMHVFDDAIDPSVYPPNAKVKILTLTLPQFLGHVITYTATDKLTIKDAIEYAANAAGGIHHDPNPRPEYAAQAATNAKLIVNGLPFGIRQLRAITRVTLRGLEPLVLAVKAEMKQP